MSKLIKNLFKTMSKPIDLFPLPSITGRGGAPYVEPVLDALRWIAGEPLEAVDSDYRTIRQYTMFEGLFEGAPRILNRALTT